MDKNAIKKFAVWARTELIARVSLKGVEYGITEDNIEDANADSVGGKVLTADEKKQRQALIAEINDKGYKQVMEEVAYTWFNRFSALRFMEVNGYLPSHVRVFTDEENNFKPQIITEAIHLDLDGLDMEKVYELKEAEKTEELYKYLLIVQCNILNKILPGMFQKIADYTELLLPDNLLRDGSVIQQMIELIPEDDWKDAVQIIGWLYQYYNSQKKDDVFAALKKNVKITKENIPAATQLFTPDWIVRYMVENSLGRLWVEGHPETKDQLLPTEEEQSAYVAGNRDPEDTKWHYYLEEAKQEPEVQAQLSEIRKEYAMLTPEQLKVIDPCCGSGHILAYMFDVLMQIYASYGYTTREAVESIVENNIYGLDIDDRAAQLAYFAVMMKARQHDRRFFSRGIQPHVYAIVESNHLDRFAIDYFCNGDEKRKEALDTIISELHDAKEYGSILTVTQQDWSALYNRFAEIEEDIHMSRETALKELLPLVQVAEALAQKYDVVVTNPPYMGASNMNPKLNEFIKKNYTDYKSDFFSAFVIHCSEMTKKSGYCGFFTPYVWMFIQSYEKMRNYLYTQATIETLIQFEYSAFEEATVPVCTFAFQNRHVKKNGCYLRLVDFRGGMEVQRQKALEAIGNHNCGFYYEQNTDNFSKIPGSPVAYWVGNNGFRAFDAPYFSERFVSGGRNKTHNNEKYVRCWWEISNFNKWKSYSNGGEYRKWYGNNIDVVNWSESARDNYASHGGLLREEYWNVPAITWNEITSSASSYRLKPVDSKFSSVSPTLVSKSQEYDFNMLAFLNSNVCAWMNRITNPTLHTLVGNILSLPDKIKNVDNSEIAKKAVEISKKDWDEFEQSKDFRKHPFMQKTYSIKTAFEIWKHDCDVRFEKLKDLEQENNSFFTNVYGLDSEVSVNVEDKNVTVRKADLGRDIRSFISYAVGCMFGRYSLDVDGLVYADGEWDKVYRYNPTVLDPEKSDGSLATLVGDYVADKNGKCYLCSFVPDKDNIIPICDDEYFEDDIVSLFVKFIKTVYGADTLDENLKFIADALGGKGQPKDVIRNYFLNDFYADHCKIYQKRPIYWLFDSGKKNGFKCLIYMHRYQPDTIARIRTDYVHEQQARYRTAIADLEKRIEGASTSERVKLNKKLTVLQAQDAEIGIYEEKIHHLADQMISIDLDDGVKHNYAIFQDVLAKIK